MKYVFFLGSNPSLSAAECFTALKREGYKPEVIKTNNRFLVVELAQELSPDFITFLGGSDRIAEYLGEQDTLWEAEEIVKALSLIEHSGEKRLKLTMGVSTLDLQEKGYAKKISLEVKKLLREQNVRANFVLPKLGSSQLNAAQVIFNKLTEDSNFELSIMTSEDKFLLARTIQIQDIRAYEARDTDRPARDPGVGMLPPKLAQIMINLVPDLGDAPKILDPFCGMGTVLQEGWLMGYEMFGMDASARMVEASEINLKWLSSLAQGETTDLPVVVQHEVRQPFPEDLEGMNAVVTEPYLGKVTTTPLSKNEVEKRISDLSDMYLKFFLYSKEVMANEGYVVMVLPAYRRGFDEKDDFQLFPDSFIDSVRNLGYSLSQLVPEELEQHYSSTERGTVLYSRPDALIGREITLWHIRKPEDRHN